MRSSQIHLNHINGVTTADDLIDPDDEEEDDDVTPPRSPLALHSSKPLLLRPADNSPFSSAHYGLSSNSLVTSGGQICNQSNGASSTNSTPYSQISVPSSYDYEDDFTSESEAEMASYLPTNTAAASASTVSTILASAASMATSDKRYEMNSFRAKTI